MLGSISCHRMYEGGFFSRFFVIIIIFLHVACLSVIVNGVESNGLYFRRVGGDGGYTMVEASLPRGVRMWLFCPAFLLSFLLWMTFSFYCFFLLVLVELLRIPKVMLFYYALGCVAGVFVREWKLEYLHVFRQTNCKECCCD